MGRLEIVNPRRGCGRVRPCLDRISLEADMVGDSREQPHEGRDRPVRVLEDKSKTGLGVVVFAERKE